MVVVRSVDGGDGAGRSIDGVDGGDGRSIDGVDRSMVLIVVVVLIGR